MDPKNKAKKIINNDDDVCVFESNTQIVIMKSLKEKLSVNEIGKKKIITRDAKH